MDRMRHQDFKAGDCVKFIEPIKMSGVTITHGKIVVANRRKLIFETVPVHGLTRLRRKVRAHRIAEKAYFLLCLKNEG